MREVNNLKCLQRAAFGESSSNRVIECAYEGREKA